MSVKIMDALQTTFCESDPKKVLISKKCEQTNFRNNSFSLNTGKLTIPTQVC